MKNTFKSLLLGASLPLGLIPLSGKGQTFTPTSPSIIQTTFPFSPISYPTGSGSLTPTVPAPLDFYYNRSGGSAYHNTTNAFGSDLDIYLWGYSHDLLEGYGAGVAYRITSPGDTVTQYRGFNSIGSDFAEVQVGMFRSNSKVYVVSFNWNPGAGPALNFWDLLPATDGLVPSSGTGGAPPSVQNVAPAWGTGVHSQHLAMDSHDMNCFAIAWEAPGIGVFVRAYRVNASGVLEQSSGPGSLTGLPELMLPLSNSVRLPDLAITHDPGTGKRMIQLAVVDTALLQIDEVTIDLDQMFTAPSVSVEDVNPISKFNSGWDEFQLSIDAPDHFTPAGLRNSWSYTYYNNDNNDINVRVCDGTVSPATFNSYVVNNGSLGNQLINNSGNAFPTIAYDNTGNELYVGWYTTYDPAAVGLALYNYVNPVSSANGGRRYVCVKMTTGGVITSLNDYMDVQSDYLDNWIGMPGFGRPGITFSKHNDGAFLFTTFNHHGLSLQWTQTLGTAYAGLPYAEGDVCLGSTPSGPYISAFGFGNALFYFDAGCTYRLGPFGSFESRVINSKMIPWASTSFFGPTSTYTVIKENKKIEIQNNPFSEDNLFSIRNADPNESLYVVLTTIDGKLVNRFEGDANTINTKLQTLKFDNLSSGSFLLTITRSTGKVEHFKLAKL